MNRWLAETLKTITGPLKGSCGILAFAWWFGLTGPDVKNGYAETDDGQQTILNVHPAEFTITGRRDPLQLIVTATHEGQTFDVTRDCEYQPEGNQVQISETGLVSPLTDGKANIKISWQGMAIRAAVTVINTNQPQPISFDFDVLPVLAQTGCSGGSCHGAPHGKAGFRLSLFGSDRELDRVSLTQEMFGRRINPIEPAKSLLLQKPSMQTSVRVILLS